MADVLELKRHAKQAIFIAWSKKHRITGFCGGLQGGKTVSGADAVAELLWDECIPLPKQAQDQGSHPEIWICSKTLALAEVAWQCFLDRWGDMVLTEPERKKLGLYRGESGTHWLRPGPRPDRKPIRVRIRTTEDPENLRATQNLIIVWGDECAYWKEEAWLNLLGRGIVTPTRYVLTTTPRGKNWFYRDVFAPAKKHMLVDGQWVDIGDNPEVACVCSRSIDNPWASKKWLEELRLKFGEDYAAQELDALFVDNAGLVYDFDRSLHVRPPPSKFANGYDIIVFGYDPGYGDPAAVGVWGRRDGVWWLLEEFYKAKMTTDDLLPWFKSRVERWKPKAIYVDKRRPSDRLLLHKHLQGKTRVLPNVEIHGETDMRVIMPMVRFLQSMLKRGKIMVSTTCPWTSEEFEHYHFKDIEERNSGENPVDWKNHAMDAMRYAICSVEELPRLGGARYRSGSDLMPRPKPARGGPVKIATAQDYLTAISAKMDKEAERAGRQDRRRQRTK